MYTVILLVLTCFSLGEADERAVDGQMQNWSMVDSYTRGTVDALSAFDGFLSKYMN